MAAEVVRVRVRRRKIRNIVVVYQKDQIRTEEIVRSEFRNFRPERDIFVPREL